MTKEQRGKRPDPFELTRDEKLYDCVSNERLEQIVFNDKTTIHTVTLSSNSYGEFLFVTVSRDVDGKSKVVTFWGLGFHEYRERWYDQEWHFHQSYAFPDTVEQEVKPEEARTIIEQRRKEVKRSASKTTEQSAMGALFEIVADLTDDDGAISEMDDLWFLLDDTPDDE